MSDSLLSVVLGTKNFVDSLTLITEYKKDNPGSEWLSSNFPHIMSQLDSLTLGWTLIPKAVVRNVSVLKDMVSNYRTNLEYGTPGSNANYSGALRHRYDELLSFLEEKVLPAIQKMPDDRKETETDAFAEAFAEVDVEPDDGGQDEEVGEVRDEA